MGQLGKGSSRLGRALSGRGRTQTGWYKLVCWALVGHALVDWATSRLARVLVDWALASWAADWLGQGVRPMEERREGGRRELTMTRTNMMRMDIGTTSATLARASNAGCMGMREVRMTVSG